MVERPILMSGPLVAAVLAGEKTVTRRLLTLPRGVPTDTLAELAGWRLERLSGAFGKPCTGEWEGVLPASPGDFVPDAVFADGPATYRVRCPFGATGDRLWVRENWAPSTKGNGNRYEYAADGASRFDILDERWRPSIHMPRAASRLSLDITEVRAERVREITEEDAIAEGCDWAAPHWPNPRDEPARDEPNDGPAPERGHRGFARDNFRRLWDSLTSAGSKWADNPWVWVVRFKRVDP